MSARIPRPHMGMTKAELNEIWGRIEGKSPMKGATLRSTTKAMFVEEIEKIRRAQMERAHGEARLSTKSRDPACQITAAEANAWLRNLPPTPPAYGWPATLEADPRKTIASDDLS